MASTGCAEQVDLDAAAAGAEPNERQHRRAERPSGRRRRNQVQLRPGEVDQAGDRQRNASRSPRRSRTAGRTALAPRIVDADHRQAEAPHSAQAIGRIHGSPMAPQIRRTTCAARKAGSRWRRAEREREAGPGARTTSASTVTPGAPWRGRRRRARDGEQERDQRGGQRASSICWRRVSPCRTPRAARLASVGCGSTLRHGFGA